MILATELPGYRASVKLIPITERRDYMKIKNRYKKPLLSKTGAQVLLMLWALITVLYYVNLQVPFAHALSNETSEEERYCKAWENGAKVSGANETEITSHCAKFL